MLELPHVRLDKEGPPLRKVSQFNHKQRQNIRIPLLLRLAWSHQGHSESRQHHDSVEYFPDRDKQKKDTPFEIT